MDLRLAAGGSGWSVGGEGRRAVTRVRGPCAVRFSGLPRRCVSPSTAKRPSIHPLVCTWHSESAPTFARHCQTLHKPYKFHPGSECRHTPLPAPELAHLVGSPGCHAATAGALVLSERAPRGRDRPLLAHMSVVFLAPRVSPGAPSPARAAPTSRCPLCSARGPQASSVRLRGLARLCPRWPPV